MCDFNKKINTNISDYVNKRSDIPDAIKITVIEESISTYMRYAEQSPEDFAQKSLKEIVDDIKTQIEYTHPDITNINGTSRSAGGSRRRRRHRRSTRTSKKGKKYSTTRRRK